MAAGSNKKSVHRLIAKLDDDHRERVVFVLGEEKRPTQKQLKRRRQIITKLRQLGYYKKKW